MSREDPVERHERIAAKRARDISKVLGIIERFRLGHFPDIKQLHWRNDVMHLIYAGLSAGWDITDDELRIEDGNATPRVLTKQIELVELMLEQGRRAFQHA